MNIKTEIKYDIGKKGVPPVVYAVQGENASRTIELHLVFNGEIFNVDDYSVSFVYKKPDGTSGWYDKLPDGSNAIDFYGNFVSVIIAPQVLSVPGEVRCAVRIEHVDSGKRRATTFPIIIDVSADPAIDAPKSENYYSVQTWDDVNERFKEIEDVLSDSIIDDARVSTNTAWSSRNIVDKLCPPFTEKGAMVVCEPVESYPLEVVSHITPTQKGSGDPSLTNIRPITGYDSVKLSRTGKNLFGGEALADAIATLGGTKDAENGTISFNPKYMQGAILFSNFREATQYTFIICGINTANTYHLNLRINYTDGTIGEMKTSVIGEEESITFTSLASKTIKDFIIMYFGGVTILRYDQCGIFEGAISAADFEPYKGDTFEIDFGQTIYGGTFNWQTGELTIDRETLVFDGVNIRCEWLGTANGNSFVYRTIKPANSDFPLCSHLKPSYAQEYGNVGISNPSVDGLIAYIQPFADGQEANAWFAEQYANGTPFTVCYELRDPVTVQLTPQEILALSGTNVLSSGTGDTEVSGKADPTAVIQDLYAKLNAVMATTAALTGV